MFKKIKALSLFLVVMTSSTVYGGSFMEQVSDCEDSPKCINSVLLRRIKALSDEKTKSQDVKDPSVTSSCGRLGFVGLSRYTKKFTE